MAAMISDFRRFVPQHRLLIDRDGVTKTPDAEIDMKRHVHEMSRARNLRTKPIGISLRALRRPGRFHRAMTAVSLRARPSILAPARDSLGASARANPNAGLVGIRCAHHQPTYYCGTLEKAPSILMAVIFANLTLTRSALTLPPKQSRTISSPEGEI